MFFDDPFNLLMRRHNLSWTILSLFTLHILYIHRWAKSPNLVISKIKIT